MGNIGFDYSNSLVSKSEFEKLAGLVETGHKRLHKGTGGTNEYSGWVRLPKNYNKSELEEIKEVGSKIREDSQVFILIGAGGSYLGARASIEALSHNFYNNLAHNKRKGPEIYYLGNNISSNYLLDLLEAIEGKDLSLNIVSKSGTTLEPALAFRFLKKYMEDKYGRKKSRERIYITTDRNYGALRKLANEENYTSFIIPEDIGGRYSVFTPVGLLPAAVAGINIDNMLKGALSGMEEYSQKKLEDNISYQYAGLRNILYKKGKYIEILVSYEPKLKYFSEWWKQLYGESEGKDGKGIFPTSASFTGDLHSLGQLIQEGRRNIFETSISIGELNKDIIVEEDVGNLDRLNFLAGKSFNYINYKAFEGTVKAHTQGAVPNLLIKLPRLDEYYLGKLLYFFKISCAMSAYILGVNPFNQPGVEEYKKNTLKLLGKE